MDTFWVIAIIIAVIVIFLLLSRKASTNKDTYVNPYEELEQRLKEEEEEINKQILSEKEVVDILMSAIDKEIGPELMQKRSIATFRSKIIATIEKDYRANPKQISEFVQSIDYKLWALKMICSVTFDALSTKRYFGENGITPTGRLYYDLNRKCLQTAYDCGYMIKNEFDISIRNLNELLYCAGDRSAYRYYEKDNYLDPNED